MTRRMLGLGIAAAVLLAACSSGSKTAATTPASTTSTTITDNRAGWDPAAVETAKILVIKVQHAFPGQCPEVMLLPHAAYLGTMKRLHLKIPGAVVDCNGFGESLEFSVFANPAERTVYVANRAKAICQAAVRGKYPLAGLHWVVGPNFAVEPESEGVSQELAPVIHGTYQVTPCPGFKNIDWDPTGEQVARQVAARLAASPRVTCKGFHFLNRDQYILIRAYNNRLPAAYGLCTGVGGTQIFIAAFSSSTISRDNFIKTETQYKCGTSKDVAGVSGSNWALVVTQSKVAAVAAVAAGGTALPPAC